MCVIHTIHLYIKIGTKADIFEFRVQGLGFRVQGLGFGV
jgi:hypothetical protein